MSLFNLQTIGKIKEKTLIQEESSAMRELIFKHKFSCLKYKRYSNVWTEAELKQLPLMSLFQINKIIGFISMLDWTFYCLLITCHTPFVYWW